MKPFLMACLIGFSLMAGAELLEGDTILSFQHKGADVRVVKRDGHLHFVNTLAVQYKCKGAKEWQRLFYKNGLCKIDRPRRNEDKNIVMIRTVKDPHFEIDEKPCNQATEKTITVSYETICKSKKAQAKN